MNFFELCSRRVRRACVCAVAATGTLAVAAGPDSSAVERAASIQAVLAQRLDSEMSQRVSRARSLLESGEHEAARDVLREALRAARGASDLPEGARSTWIQRLGAEIRATERRSEEIEVRAVEGERLNGLAMARERALAALESDREATTALMTRFDALMEEGRYNVLFTGGTGDIAAAIAPFAEARQYAVQARAKDPLATAPRAGVFLAMAEGSLATERMNEELTRYRSLLTMNDVTRASVPFPDTLTIEYPESDRFRDVTERRIPRFGAGSLNPRDPKTLAILTRLDRPVRMPFPQETSLEDVIRYVKSATSDAEWPQGIPIYIDPVGLREADRTMQSLVSLNIEGVPLKKSLKLVLKQLDLTYAVRDGLVIVGRLRSSDQPTALRDYPIADLAIIPMSLLGSGGMGGNRGGFGGRGAGGGRGLGLGGR